MTYYTAGALSLCAVGLAGVMLMQDLGGSSPVEDYSTAAPTVTVAPEVSTPTEDAVVDDRPTSESDPNNAYVPEDSSLPASYSVAALFSDVSNEAWYTPFIERVVVGGYMGGNDEGLFQPEAELNFAEFAVALTNAYYGTTLINSKLMYSGEHWATPYIATLKIEYTKENTAYVSLLESIHEYDPLTRFQASYLVGMLLEDKGIATQGSEVYQPSIADFSDLGTASHPDLLAKSVYYGLMEGKPELGFDGDVTLTRGEACVILGRLLDMADLALDKVSIYQDSSALGDSSATATAPSTTELPSSGEATTVPEATATDEATSASAATPARQAVF